MAFLGFAEVAVTNGVMINVKGRGDKMDDIIRIWLQLISPNNERTGGWRGAMLGWSPFLSLDQAFTIHLFPWRKNA